MQSETESKPIKTVLTICLSCVVLYFFWRFDWLLYGALILGTPGLFFSRVAYWIDYVWMKLAWVLGAVVPNILLAIIFFGLLFPLAVLSRLFGNADALSLKNKKSSLFIEVNKTFGKGSLEKPW